MEVSSFGSNSTKDKKSGLLHETAQNSDGIDQATPTTEGNKNKCYSSESDNDFEMVMYDDESNSGIEFMNDSSS